MPHDYELHEDMSEGAGCDRYVPKLGILQHLNPALAIGEIKMLLTGHKHKPAAIVEPKAATA
jgi:hypothetical protein